MVIKKINDLIYRIRLGPNTKSKVVHRNRLWQYKGSNPPNWYKGTQEPKKLDTATSTPPPLSSADDSPKELRRSTRNRHPVTRYGQN